MSVWPFVYYMNDGGCGSGVIEMEFPITDEEKAIIDQAVAEKKPLSDIPELQDLITRAYEDIKAEVECELYDVKDPYAMESFGYIFNDESGEWDVPEGQDEMDYEWQGSPFDSGYYLSVNIYDPIDEMDDDYEDEDEDEE